MESVSHTNAAVYTVRHVISNSVTEISNNCRISNVNTVREVTCYYNRRFFVLVFFTLSYVDQPDNSHNQNEHGGERLRPI